MEISNKRVLVSGAGGFIPSHLTRRLVNLGADVCVITKYNSIIDNIRISDIWDKITVLEADLRNFDSLQQIKEVKPDVIFHLAAYNHVGDSFTHVSESLDCNTKGTANLIESYDGYERFIYMSSSEIYGYQESVPFVEDSVPYPISPYAIGKYGGELYCRMKVHSSNNPIVVIRVFNTFGPYQSPRAIIGEMIINCLSGRKIVSTEGVQTREFNFVANIVDALILAAEYESALGQVINIGSSDEISIRDLIHKIHNMTASSSKLDIGALDNRPTEIWRMFADSDRAKELLGWKPKITFDDGLQLTINWFKRFLDVYMNNNSSLLHLGEY